MPPRHAYWTILIDDKPTAFRARERAELLPTFTQLQRTNPNIAMKWFARGRLWETQEAEREDFQRRKRGGAAGFGRGRTGTELAPPGAPPAEKRGRDWRPGGAHKDPRDRFKKKKDERRPREDRPWGGKPAGPPRGDRPWSNKPRGDRPWSDKPRGDRPWQNKPAGPPRGDRPGGERPWGGKPAGPPRGDRPWSNKPRGDRPWSNKPGNDRSWSNKPGRPPRGNRPPGPRKPPNKS